MLDSLVSTHSRPKAAGYGYFYAVGRRSVSTHSRPKAAGLWRYRFRIDGKVSTHSRPKAAGSQTTGFSILPAGFNTQPPEGGWDCAKCYAARAPAFQHTAARRRLAVFAVHRFNDFFVSTHSRPKAAGNCQNLLTISKPSFNTQPPEGGWQVGQYRLYQNAPVSTHSRPKAAGWQSGKAGRSA